MYLALASTMNDVRSRLGLKVLSASQTIGSFLPSSYLLSSFIHPQVVTYLCTSSYAVEIIQIIERTSGPCLLPTEHAFSLLRVISILKACVPMDLSHMMTAHLATATEDEKLRSLCDEQNKVGMQNCLSSETPLGRSSEPSSPGPLTITNVEELCKRLEKHKKELVDLVEGLIQHTEKGDKEGTWKFALAAVKELQLLPRANQPIDSLPIGKMTYEDVEKYFGLEPQRPLRGTSWEGPLPHIQLPQCACELVSP